MALNSEIYKIYRRFSSQLVLAFKIHISQHVLGSKKSIYVHMYVLAIDNVFFWSKQARANLVQIVQPACVMGTHTIFRDHQSGPSIIQSRYSVSIINKCYLSEKGWARYRCTLYFAILIQFTNPFSAYRTLSVGKT